MWDVHDLPTLVEELSAEDLLAQRIDFDLLAVNLDHRVRTGCYQQGLRVHTYALDSLEAHVWKINPVWRDLLGQQRMRNLVEAAFLCQFVAVRAQQSRANIDVSRDGVLVH